MELKDKGILKSEITTTKRVKAMLSFTILLMGLLLFVGTVMDQLSGTLFQSYETLIHKFNEGIFYSCIGLICVILGLERTFDIARIDSALESQNLVLKSIDAHISEYRQYKLLETYHDIYNISLELVEKARSNIRSVVYANSPKAPDSWNERVAEILKNKNDAGYPVQFDIVICINPEDMNEQFFEASERRFQIYKNKGTDIFFHRYIQNMEKTIGYDCLIIDDCHLILSFPTILSNKTQKAVFFENQKDTVSQFINWFNSYAMFEALSMKTVIRNLHQKRNEFSNL